MTWPAIWQRHRRSVWQRHRRSVFWLLGFVVVLWIAFTVTAPPGSGDATPRPASSTQVTMPPGCPLTAPNAAAGCLIIKSP